MRLAIAACIACAVGNGAWGQGTSTGICTWEPQHVPKGVRGHALRKRGGAGEEGDEEEDEDAEDHGSSPLTAPRVSRHTDSRTPERIGR
jgi:hypothetical protein